MKGGKGVNVKEIPCDEKLEWPLLALKKKGGISQRTQVTSRTWKRKWLLPQILQREWSAADTSTSAQRDPC